MERIIAGFHLDELGDWVAELVCGHDQHVRHRPPFQIRAWVLHESGREERIGVPLDCSLCERAELPDGLRFIRSSPEWSQDTIPTALLRSHRVGTATWGLLRVHQGKLRFVMSGEPGIDIVLGIDSVQPIPPDVPHRVEPDGVVRFAVEFLTVDRSENPRRSPERECEVGGSSRPRASEEGGDAACWARLVCFECGAIVEGGSHRPDCKQVRPLNRDSSRQ